MNKRIRYAKPINVDELEHIIFKVGKTAIFDDNVMKSMFLEQAGFISIVDLTAAEYVKKLIDNYVEPAMASSSEDLNQKYINRMLGHYEETRDIDVSTTPVIKPRKNKP